MEIKTDIYLGDCKDVLKDLPENSIGIEINSEYYEMVKKTLELRKLVLFDSRENYGKDKNYRRYTIR
jgi:DNA modification methylase